MSSRHANAGHHEPTTPHRQRNAWLVALLLLVTPWHVEAATQPIVIRDVTVITGDGSAPLPGRTVTVDSGRITAVTVAHEAVIPADAVVIEGDGRYLLPGFIDTHAHVAIGPVTMRVEQGVPVMTMQPLNAVPEATARALLAHGITTARDPGGNARRTVATRKRIATGKTPGPALQVAGEVIDTSRFDGLATTVTTPDQVRREVARQAALGVDWIKLYCTPP